MLMLLACFATFLFSSSKAATLGWAGAGGGLLVMEGRGSREDSVPMLDKAAVIVADGNIDTQRKTIRSTRLNKSSFRFYPDPFPF